MKKKHIALLAALACTLLSAGQGLAAGTGSTPAELDADTVEYDMTTGVITATDNVLMKQGETRIAGQKAVYNSKTQQGTVTGGVIAAAARILREHRFDLPHLALHGRCGIAVGERSHGVGDLLRDP